MTPAHQKHLYAQRSHVTTSQREALLRQRGCVVWFTGLSGSGKSTVAHALEARLFREGHAAFVLDGDNIRRRLNANLGFSEADRHENIRRVAEVAHLFAEAGIICIAAFISPFCSDRDKARALIGAERMFEVYLSTPLNECERRDPKGLYAKARAGRIPEFTGLSSPYEPPPAPALEIDTTACGVDEAADRIFKALQARGVLHA